MPISSRSPRPKSVDPTPLDMRGEIALIGEQQRETLALLRQLVEMLLPRGDPDKPKPEDLIAALVGQQTRMLVLPRQIGTDVSDVLDRLAPEGEGRLDRQQSGNGGIRP